MSCWVMTTGEAGMRSQALGLAERIGMSFVEKTVSLQAPWRWLPGHMAPGALSGVGASSDPLEPPWPELLITCGRRSVALSIAIKKASGGKTFTVHIQDPRVPCRYFDLIAAPRHDRVVGDNVYPTLGALHKVTPEKLGIAAEQFKDQFAALSKPLIAVLIGGTSKSYNMSPQIADRIAQQLKALTQQGCGMVLTFSQRTGETNQEIISGQLADTDVMIWDGHGENPYFAMLAMADYILVTSDSVSMITEAASTGKPVLTMALEGGSKKFDAFHGMMQGEGITQPFAGMLEGGSHTPLDETGRIAAIVLEKLNEQVS